MSKNYLSKKKIREIERLSIIHEFIKKHYYNFVDNPPDMWDREEKELYDTLAVFEITLKEEIIKILNK